MAGKSITFLLLALSLVVFSLLGVEARVPAIYVFGDSTVDVGNNNYLPNTTILGKADRAFYGIDFTNSTPTGRFSNGFNTIDEMAKLLGFPMSPPPFLSLTKENFNQYMFKGINFASGGSGIFENTGLPTVKQVIPMGLQIQYFATVSSNLKKWMGSRNASVFLSRCIFFISTGSNDMFEYSHYKGNNSDATFLTDLAYHYQDHIRVLHQLGARKFAIVSAPPIGCCPSQRARNTTGDGCYEMLNDLSRRFYGKLKALLEKLQAELKGMKYALGNGYAMVDSIMANPGKFKEIKKACCGQGRFYGEAPCGPTFSCCTNRSEYLFFDWFHPTEAVSRIAATVLYKDNAFISPINIKQLAED